ncbi:unconventional myosin-X-like [Oscarella lobularis]|uniref:unconventional myosin-X-like n=1 Tax=Oscarella lobularis TaxID=121494 RepID=UPI00331389D6
MRSSRPPPPPPPASGIGGDEGPDVVANSAMIALQRLAQDNESLQAEVRHLRDQIAVEGQEHARLIETYRLEHEEDVRKLQNGVKLATALAEENAALKNQANRRSVPGAIPGARGGGGANDDVNDIQQIEREVAILQSNVMRLDARWGRRRNDASLGIGLRQMPLWKQLRTLNVQIERLLQLVPKSAAAKTKESRASDSRMQYNLTELSAPVTEYAILTSLQERFVQGDFYTLLGPHLVSVNPFSELGADCPTLRSYRAHNAYVDALARDVVFRAKESSQSQTIILSGESGSGKTYGCHSLVRALLQLLGGARNADTLKVISASLSLLSSLSCAWTETNSNSSRAGQFIELTFEDSVVLPQCHWYYIDQARIVHRSIRERNFHIFYQMLAGLTDDEKSQYHLNGYTVGNLRYLQCDGIQMDEAAERERFIHFKNCMDALRIPVADVIRIMASVALLGNVYFNEKPEGITDVAAPEVLQAVSSLLGVPANLLAHGFTKKIRTFRGHTTKTACTVAEAIAARDSLAKTLYIRTVIAMLKRANSLLRKLPTASPNSRSSSKLGSPSPSSLDSAPLTPSVAVAAKSPPTFGRVGSGASPRPSLRQESSAMVPKPPPFVGILDLFGFEHCQENGLGQLCSNFCSEMIRNLYKASVFDAGYDYLRFESVNNPFEIPIDSNKPILDLLVEENGVFDVLDRESLFVKGNTESFMAKLKQNLKSNPGFVCSNGDHQNPLFGIKHYDKHIIYEPADFISDNRDVIYDDILGIFHKQNCSFKFVTHLFQQDLKSLPQQGTAPKGHQRRILPFSSSSAKDEPRKTLSQDVQDHLNFLMRVMSTSNNYFVRCLKSNATEEPDCFDSAVVAKQIRSLQMLETTQLYVSGLPHFSSFRDFATRYGCLLPQKTVNSPEVALSDCHKILQRLQDEYHLPSSSHVNWAFGTDSVFFRENVRKLLEQYRLSSRERAATLIQSHVRRRIAQSKYRFMREVELDGRRSLATRHSLDGRRLPNGESIGGLGAAAPPPIPSVPPSHYEMELVKRTCHIHGLDVDVPPPIPATRPYTVKGGMKLIFPHQRIIRQSYQSGTDRHAVFMRGERVTVVGPSPRRGYLMVDRRGITVNVPSNIMEVAPPVPSATLEGTSDL